MANEEHVALLKKGVKVWNKWRQANPRITPDLSESVLATLFLIEFDVDKGHFIGINLQEANLSRANLTLADLTSANLSRANLNSANLQRADITLANLTLADLSDSELIETRALGTNFNLARLTGACLENWHIDGDTKLDDVLCDYVYLRYFQKERCPSHDKFAPGEFTKRFQVTQNVIELAFRDGVPWKAFAYAFDESNIKVLDEYGDELFLQEYKVLGGGLVTLKVCYPPNANGDKIKDFLEQRTYELELKVATLEGEVKAKDSAFEKLVRVLGAPKIQADHITTINVQTGQTNSMSGDNIYTGGGNYIKSNHGTYIEGDQNIYASDQRQSLKEVIAAIQQLLDYLEQPSQTSISAQQVAEQAAARHPALRDPQIVELAVKNTPTLQMRLRSALTAMGIETVKVIFAPAGIPIEGIKAWLEPE